MALTDSSVKTVKDGSTLFFNALSQIPSAEFEEAKALAISQLQALNAETTKPSPEDVIKSFVDTLDDVAHDTGNAKFIAILDIIDSAVAEIVDGGFNFFKGITTAFRLKKAAQA